MRTPIVLTVLSRVRATAAKSIVCPSGGATLGGMTNSIFRTEAG